MSSMRTTFTMDEQLADQARELGVNVSAAARAGVATAVAQARLSSDRAAYQQQPERPDSFWDEAEAWVD